MLPLPSVVLLVEVVELVPCVQVVLCLLVLVLVRGRSPPSYFGDQNISVFCILIRLSSL